MAQTVIEDMDMEKWGEVSQKAYALAAKLTPKVPGGKAMLDLYRPMAFRKRKYKNIEIKPQVQQLFDVVNMRYAILLGLRTLKVDFGRPTQFNLLYRNGNLLTSDRPVEIYQQFISFRYMRGRVLVGGLGLGMAAEMILRLSRVRSVTVVEVDKDIIDLVQPQISKDIEVVHADLYEYLKTPQAKHYDSAYHDIWCTCGESSWVENLVPLYRLSRHAGIRTLGAWGEWEMRSQLISALCKSAMLPKEYSHWKPYAVFVDAMVRRFGMEPPFPENLMGDVMTLLRLYLGKIGSPLWEKTFRWDEIKGGGE